MKKKILAILLACTMAAGLAVSPVGTETVRAEDDWEIGTYNGFQYDAEGDSLTIIGYEGTDTEIQIPDTINGKTVTGLRFAFRGCSSLTSVEIPSSVTHIYHNSFEGCSSLTSIKIPSSVVEIGSRAFQDCSSLTSIIIPQSVTDIGAGAFYGCSSLTSITIPSNVKRSKGNPFGNCSQLKEILVEEGNNSRWVSKDGVLYSNNEEELISYPAGKDTAQVSIPEDVTIIGVDAFLGCDKLTSIAIPSSVTEIDSYAFSGCSNLTGVTISSNVKNMSIGTGAFSHCSSLASITIPSGVTSMGFNPFMGCSQLKEVLVEGNDSRWVSKGDVLYSKEGVLISYLPGKGTKPVNIPEGVSRIGQYAFAYSGLTDITIPEGVTEIDMRAFSYCSSLTSVVIPEGVTKLCSYTFQYCNSLASVTIPLSMMEIDLAVIVGVNNQIKAYYAGSEEQWSKIKDNNPSSTFQNVHYNFTGSEESGSDDVTTPTNPADPGTETPGKTDQAITAKNITKTYGAKAFNLNAKSSVGTALTYTVSDKKVAAVDKKGKVTIKGCGITNITITAKGTDKYNQAEKTIKLTVKPKKMTISSVKSTKKKTAAVKWKQDKKASGYIIQCATDSKFKKNKVQVTVSNKKTVSKTIKNLKAGKKYYIRACAYAKAGKTKVQGDWSKVKTVKVKK